MSIKTIVELRPCLCSPLAFEHCTTHTRRRSVLSPTAPKQKLHLHYNFTSHKNYRKVTGKHSMALFTPRHGSYTQSSKQNSNNNREKMCKVHNSVGCLTTVKSHLRSHNINDFDSLKEVIDFQKSFSALRQQIISNHEQLIEQEKTTLVEDILQLDNSIKANRTYFESYLLKNIEEIKQKSNSLSTSGNLNFILRFVNYVKQWFYKRKVQHLEYNLDSKVNYFVRVLFQQHQVKTNRLHHITTNFTDAVNESSLNQVKELENKLLIKIPKVF